MLSEVEGVLREEDHCCAQLVSLCSGHQLVPKAHIGHVSGSSELYRTRPLGDAPQLAVDSRPADDAFAVGSLQDIPFEV